MEQSPSWGANHFLASREIPCNLWNLKFHYHIHMSLPPVPVPSQSDPVHGPTSHFLIFHWLIAVITHYCKQLNEWRGEGAKQREQAALTYRIESAVETCLYGTRTCNASWVPHGWKWQCQLGLSGLENNIQAGLLLHAFTFTRLESFHHFPNLHIIFSLTWYGIDNTW
jgi:hypothetical protein